MFQDILDKRLCRGTVRYTGTEGISFAKTCLHYIRTLDKKEIDTGGHLKHSSSGIRWLIREESWKNMKRVREL